MGLALWLVGGTAAFLLARIIPFGRGGWAGELAAALASALLFGVVATALDFGGWKEIDWLAVLFVLIGSFAATGALRALTLLRKRT